MSRCITHLQDFSPLSPFLLCGSTSVLEYRDLQLQWHSFVVIASSVPTCEPISVPGRVSSSFSSQSVSVAVVLRKEKVKCDVHACDTRPLPVSRVGAGWFAVNEDNREQHQQQQQDHHTCTSLYLGDCLDPYKRNCWILASADGAHVCGVH